MNDLPAQFPEEDLPSATDGVPSAYLSSAGLSGLGPDATDPDFPSPPSAPDPGDPQPDAPSIDPPEPVEPVDPPGYDDGTNPDPPTEAFIPPSIN